jgi:hypothetical protein
MLRRKGCSDMTARFSGGQPFIGLNGASFRLLRG